MSIIDLLEQGDHKIEDIDFSPLFNKGTQRSMLTDSSLAIGSRSARTCLRYKDAVIPTITLTLYILVGYAFYNHHEGWNLLDSTYFAILTITTVGFGDLVPTSDGSKLFTIVYAFFGIGMVGTALGQVASWIYILQEKYSKKATLAMLKESLKTASMVQKAGGVGMKFVREKSQKLMQVGKQATNSLKHSGAAVGAGMKGMVPLKNMNAAAGAAGAGAGAVQKRLGELKDSTKNSSIAVSTKNLFDTSKHGVYKVSSAAASALGCMWRLYHSRVYTVLMILTPLVVYILLGIGLGTIEGWSVLDSVYVSCITITGIGYGDLAPSTPAGRLFAVFYMPIGVVVTLNVVSTLALTKMVHRHRTAVPLSSVIEMDKDQDGQIDRFEFLAYMLIALQKVDKNVVDLLSDQFSTISKGKWSVSVAEIQKLEIMLHV
jgi:hypothetical protein